MKATKRSGRCGKNGKPYSTKHNDRNFDYSQDGHIDSSKVSENIVWKYYDDEPSFEDSELRFYRENYQENQDRVNENYRNSRHSEKEKSIEQIYRSPKMCPEDEVLQIGSLKSGTIEDRKLFEKIVMEYATEMTRRYGSNMHILDIAFHYDESSPHCHIRKVYDVTNQFGMKEINQNQALKELGFEIPKPQNKEGKYNNRKISFDNTNRQIWYDIIESHGIKLDREPVSPKQFNKDFVSFKYEEGRKLLEENQKLKKEKEYLENEVKEYKEDIEELNDKYKSLVSKNTSLNAKITKTEKELDETIKAFEELEKDYKEEKEKLTQLEDIVRDCIGIKDYRTEVIETMTKKADVETLKSISKMVKHKKNDIGIEL